MAPFEKLAKAATRARGPALDHLKRLAASWGLLADLSFSDLLLYVESADSEPDAERFVVLGQIRPMTSQTLYRTDQVGRVADAEDLPLVTRTWRLGQILDGEGGVGPSGERARIQCIPVRHKGELIGVLTRSSALAVGRRPGELENVYDQIFGRFARMIAGGDFPFEAVDAETEDAPRVGDGVMLLDGHGRVEYASPNAVSLLNRMGTDAAPLGARLAELGVPETAIAPAFQLRLPVTDEVEVGPVAAMVRCVPLLDGSQVTGAVVLARDVSDLRRLGRQLVSMDATIREVHHRVKNNLQTVSSLLRLQARRLESGEARSAVDEAIRRVRSIALVHETLSRSTGEQSDFSEILRGLVRLVEEDLTSPDRVVRFTVRGEAGVLPADVATPLAVVLTELFQNAVEHAFPDDGGPWPNGSVEISLYNDGLELRAVVEDNGAGLPAGFSLGTSTSLGLSIVRALVESELGGTIAVASTGPGGGTRVELRVPVQPALGGEWRQPGG